jgi:hypothetical protein
MCTTPHASLPATVSFIHIPINDIDDITPHLPSIISFISSALSPYPHGINDLGKEKENEPEKKVLVHCHLGRESGDGEGEEEDVLVGFYRRLRERKMGLLKGGGEDEGRSVGEDVQKVFQADRGKIC